MSTEPTYEQMTTAGAITWLSSEDEGGPDCGAVLGLGGGWCLRIGEISETAWENAGGHAMNLGDDSGRWITLFGPNETHVLGIASSEIDVNGVLTLLGGLIRKQS